MKKQLRKAMICTIAMMVAAVVSLTGVTYAWFSQSETATVDGISMTVVSQAGGILMSGVPAPTTDQGWAYKLSVGYTESGLWPASTAPQNVEADTGDLQFYYGILNDANLNQLQTKKVTLQTENTPATGFETVDKKEGDYFRKDIYFKNIGKEAKDLTVYLNALATAVPDKTANGADTYLRVAVVDHGAYTMNGKNVELTHDVGENGYSKGSYKYSADDVKIFEVNPSTHYDSTENIVNTFPVIKDSTAYFNAVDEAGTLSDKIATDGLDTYTSTNGYFTSVKDVYNTSKKLPINVDANTYHMITVYVWLEGQDVDCINEQSGGSFGVKLDFTKAVRTASS